MRGTEIRMVGRTVFMSSDSSATERRVVVVDGSKIVGILEALDLFSFLSNQSHLITEKIEDAKDLEGLSQAAAQITRVIVKRRVNSGS